MSVLSSRSMPTERDAVDISSHPDFQRLLTRVKSLTRSIEEGDALFDAANNAIAGVPIDYTARARFLVDDFYFDPNALDRIQVDAEFSHKFETAEDSYKISIVNYIRNLIFNHQIDASILGDAWAEIEAAYDSGLNDAFISELDFGVISAFADQVLQATAEPLDVDPSTLTEDNLAHLNMPSLVQDLLRSAAEYGSAIEQDAEVREIYQRYNEQIAGFNPAGARAALGILDGIIGTIPNTVIGFDTSFFVSKLRGFSTQASETVDYLEETKAFLENIEFITDSPLNQQANDLRDRVAAFLANIPGVNPQDYAGYLEGIPTQAQVDGLVSAAERAAYKYITSLDPQALTEAIDKAVYGYPEDPFGGSARDYRMKRYSDTWRPHLDGFRDEYTDLFIIPGFDWLSFVIGFVPILGQAQDLISILEALGRGDLLGAALEVLVPASAEKLVALTGGLRRQARQLNNLDARTVTLIRREYPNTDLGPVTAVPARVVPRDVNLGEVAVRIDNEADRLAIILATETPRPVLEAYSREIRTEYAQIFNERRRNIGIAVYNINGVSGILPSISGAAGSNVDGFAPFVRKEEMRRLFRDVRDIPRQGRGHSDSEAKILYALAHQFQGDLNVTGHIVLYSELQFCDSCSDVIAAFRTLFPNITITPVHTRSFEDTP